MIKVRFFARLREELGVDQLQVEWSSGMTVADLLVDLKRRSDLWQKSLSSPNILIAVEQRHATVDTMLDDAAEVAFFPPVTGG